MFDRIHLWSHPALGFCFLRDFLNTVLISVLVIELFMMYISFWFILGRLNVPNTLLISPRLSILLPYSCSKWRRKWQPTPVFLPGKSQGQRSLVGCHLWDRTELDTTEVTYQQQQQLFIIVSYNLLYFCIVCWNLSFFIYDFVDFILLSFSLDESG